MEEDFPPSVEKYQSHVAALEHTERNSAGARGDAAFIQRVAVEQKHRS